MRDWKDSRTRVEESKGGVGKMWRKGELSDLVIGD
jgi:hypothetical protein